MKKHYINLIIDQLQQLDTDTLRALLKVLTRLNEREAAQRERQN